MLFCVVSSDRTKGYRYKLKYRKFFKHKKTPFLGGQHTLSLETVKSLLGDIQKITGPSPEQPAVTDPALSRGLDHKIPGGALLAQLTFDAVLWPPPGVSAVLFTKLS